jgi:cytochrome c oxidase subunit 2
MTAALLMVLVVIGSLLFHFLNPWRITPIASNWTFIDDTLGITFVVTTFGFVAVILFMAYCLYRFRHQPNSRAAYEPENQKLEMWLGAVTTVAVVILLAPGLLVWGQFITVPKDAMEIEAMGAQWQWSYRFPGADNRLGATDVRFIDTSNPMGINPNDPNGQDDRIVTNGDLHVPIGKPIKMLLRSIDVIHDFYVPEIRAKMDLMPGLVSYFWFTPTKAGQFDVLCAAFCGIGHPQMRSKIIVESESDFQAWLAQQQTFAQSRKADAARKKHATASDQEKPAREVQQ